MVFMPTANHYNSELSSNSYYILFITIIWKIHHTLWTEKTTFIYLFIVIVTLNGAGLILPIYIDYGYL